MQKFRIRSLSAKTTRSGVDGGNVETRAAACLPASSVGTMNLLLPEVMNFPRAVYGTVENIEISAGSLINKER